MDSNLCNLAWSLSKDSLSSVHLSVPCSNFRIRFLYPVILPLWLTISSCISTLPPAISILCLSLARCLCNVHFKCLLFLKVLPHTHAVLVGSKSIFLYYCMIQVFKWFNSVAHTIIYLTSSIYGHGKEASREEGNRETARTHKHHHHQLPVSYTHLTLPTKRIV